MPNKNAKNKNEEENNTYYGIPEGMLEPDDRNRIDQHTCEYYMKHPDKLPDVNWNAADEELKKQVQDSLEHRHLRYVLDQLGLREQINEQSLLLYIRYDSFENFVNELTKYDYSCGPVFQKIDWTAIPKESKQKFLSHLAPLYYAAKKDEEEAENTSKFLEKPGVLNHMRKKLPGMTPEALNINIAVFGEYRRLLTGYINELEATNSVWGCSPAYSSLKTTMESFDSALHQELSINENEHQLESNVHKFHRLLNGIHDACKDYINTHKPQKGQTYRDLKLSRTQLKRLSIINEMEQLYDLFSQKRAKNWVFDEDRNPASVKFNKERAALKLVNRYAAETIKSGKDTKDRKCHRILFAKNYRNNLVQNAVSGGSDFTKMCNQQFAEYRKYEEDPNSRGTEVAFYIGLADKTGKQLLSDFNKVKAASARKNTRQSSAPVL